MSDDIEAATHKLLIKENSEFDILFPGVGDIGSPGKKDPFTFSYFCFELWKFIMYVLVYGLNVLFPLYISAY